MIPVQDFKREVLDWVEEVGIQPREIHVREMKNKWASCSSRGRVTFSYALLTRTKEERAYVIVHELLHLRYPSHNKMFKTLLNTHMQRLGVDPEEIRASLLMEGN